MKEKNRLKKNLIYRMTAVFIFILTLFLMKKMDSEFLMHIQGDGTLDMNPGYHTEYVYRMLKMLGAEGRFLCIKALCVDFIFITSFAVIQNELLKWVMGKKMQNTQWRLLLILAYLRGIFDIAENIFILTLLLNFPKELPSLVIISSWITSIKFLFLKLWLAALPIVFIIRVTRYKEWKMS